jgi:hypothetical protein
MMEKLTYIPCNIEALKGSVVRAVDVENDVVTLYLADDYCVRLAHQQDCCENVEFVDSDVPLTALIGEVIIEAEERTNTDLPPPQYLKDQNYLWTFYTIRTAKSSCTMRWYGNSEYYSVSVDAELGIDLRRVVETRTWETWPPAIRDAIQQACSSTHVRKILCAIYDAVIKKKQEQQLGQLTQDMRKKRQEQ